VHPQQIIFLNMMKLLLQIFLLCFLSNCTPNWYKPLGYHVFSQMPKGGTPGFNLGWTHGCESGMGSQFGGALYMTFYTWKKDPDIASSNPDLARIRGRYSKELGDIDWNNLAMVKKNLSDYNAIFWAAHAFCRHSALGALQNAGMTPPLEGETRYDPGAHSIGKVWSIGGSSGAAITGTLKGDTRWAAGGMW
jgi:hypothetical protein